MSYPPYQYQQSTKLQEEDLQQMALATSKLLADDDVLSTLLAEKLSMKINVIVKAETDKLRSRIEMLEHENRKILRTLGIADQIEKRTQMKSTGAAPAVANKRVDDQVLKKKIPVNNDGARVVAVGDESEKKSVVMKEGYGQNPPYGGAPYPPQNPSAPYPSSQSPYPGQGGIFPPSLGFKADAPLFMPAPGYPPAQSNPAYPPQNKTPYPNTSSPYPPQSHNSPYPTQSQTSPYPPQSHNSPYPPQSQTSSYPAQSNNSPYPPQSNNSPYPPQSQTSSYPPQSNNSPYPPKSQTSPYPPQSRSPYHSSSTSYPTSNYGSASSHKGSSYPSPHHRASYTSGSVGQHASTPPKTSYPSGVSYKTNTTTYSHVVPVRKMTPTVIPANPFNARGDAEILRKAMVGFGTDEKTIINVLTRRSNAQRLQITLEFKTLYGKDLIKDLKSETRGKFEDILVALMTPLPQFYARELHDAISGLGTDEEVLIEVLCTKSNNEIRTIRAAYHSMYSRPLEDDLIGDTSGTFKRLMVSLCNACRDESTVTNNAAATKDAQDLLRAGELKLGTDESTFNMILCQRSYAQLRLIFEEYYKITGHDFENAIKNEFSGTSKDGLLAIVRSIRNLPGFFAKCLHSAIAGLGTNDRQLIRVVVTRCETDMGEIKEHYLAQYGETLADAIKGDTSGDYKKCLLALIGES